MTVGMFGIGKEIVRAIMDITGIRDFLGFMRLERSRIGCALADGDVETAWAWRQAHPNGYEK